MRVWNIETGEEITVTGTIEYPEQPPNTWREVCRWDEHGVAECGEEGRWVAPDDGLGYIHAMPLDDDTVIAIDSRDWRTRYEQLLKIARRLEERVAREDMVDAFKNMAAAFEELAGQHRETLRDLADMDLLYDTLWREFNSLQALPPSPGPDYSLVRQHWARRRRSKTAPEARAEGEGAISTGTPDATVPCAQPDEPTAAQQMDRLLPESGETPPGNWYNTDLLDDPAIHKGLEDCAEGRVSKYEERSE